MIELEKLLMYCDENLHYNHIDGFITFKTNSKCNPNRIGKKLGTKTKRGYIKTVIFKKNILVHRLCYIMHYRKYPSGLIDHIDGNPENNRISNLRDVDGFANMRNQKIHRSGARIGVHKSGKRFRARVFENGKNTSIGSYECDLMAEMAVFMYRLGEIKKTTKESKHKITKTQSVEILTMHKTGFSKAEISKRFGVHFQTISKIIKGEITGYRPDE